MKNDLIKRYAISKGTITNNWSKPELEASELLNGYYQIDDGEMIFSSFDKAEAEKEFAKYTCDCYLEKTNIGYQANIEYYELSEEEGEINENGEFEVDYINATPAPFSKEMYKYSGYDGIKGRYYF